MNTDDKAERIQRAAIRKMTVFAIAFVIWQLSYFTIARPPAGETVRNVDIVRTIGFLGWSAALLLLFAKGGGALAPKPVRAIIDDELARAQRAIAYRNGFWAMTLVNFLGYILAMTTQLRPIDLAHIGLSAGVLTVLVSQVLLARETGD